MIIVGPFQMELFYSILTQDPEFHTGETSKLDQISHLCFFAVDVTLVSPVLGDSQVRCWVPGNIMCRYLSLPQLHCKCASLHLNQQLCPCLVMGPTGLISDLQTDFLASPHNHRITEVWKDLLRSSSPNSPLKQGPLCRTASSWVLILHRWRLDNLSRQAIPVFALPHTKKKFSWI